MRKILSAIQSNTTDKNSILIIEDSEVMMAVLVKILEPDYQLYLAKDGQMGIEAANQYLPDLILADIIMPNMDGFEVIQILHNSKKTKMIPIIFITGLNNNKYEKKGLHLGASDYIRKPFDDTIVKLRVGTQMRIVNYIRTIEHMGMTDQLTGLPNRRSFNSRLEIAWTQAIREKKPISLLTIDIDNFKKYNDTYGHNQGDKALQSVAAVIEKVFKGENNFYARWGGEEFTVLLSNTNVRDTVQLAEKTRKSIEDVSLPVAVNKMTNISVSIGVYTQTPKETSSIQDFFYHSDDALYIAKKEGKNRVCVSPACFLF